MSPYTYNQEVRDKVMKFSKKAPDRYVDNTCDEGKNIANWLKINDKIQWLDSRQSFIVVKDHKVNFANNPSVQLINPHKN